MAEALRWRHNGHDGVSNHQPHDCLLNRLFRRRSKKTSKFRVTGHCAGNSPGTGEIPAQMASNAENVSIWWRLHGGLARSHGISSVNAIWRLTRSPSVHHIYLIRATCWLLPMRWAYETPIVSYTSVLCRYLRLGELHNSSIWKNRIWYKYARYTCGPIHWHGLTLIPAWTSNDMSNDMPIKPEVKLLIHS